ncbi:MAG: transglutaminase family protein [Candidatus Bathyarchaeia archaeon]
MEPLNEYLQKTFYVDNSDELQKAVENIRSRSFDETKVAVSIFNFVRDVKWGASPIYKASESIKKIDKPQICVSKAILQVALCRIAGIPSRFHCWKVRFSQETVEKINETLFKDAKKKFRTAELYHVAAEVYLGSWLIADATIDKALEPIFVSNTWTGNKHALINGFDLLEDFGTSSDVPKIAIETSTSQNQPIYIRPFSPILTWLFNKQINQLLENIRSLQQ